MKNKAINTLSYTGEVTLSQQIGKKKVEIAKVHNSGGISLFSFLADCLVGNFSQARVNVPRKIKLLNREVVNGIYQYESVSGFIFLRTTAEIKESSSGKCQVRYSFTIPRDMLENISNVSTLGIGLYSQGALEEDPESFMAFCEIADLNQTQMVNSSLLVDWDLLISNATTKIDNSNR